MMSFLRIDASARLVVALLVELSLATQASGQCELSKLTASDGTGGANFGRVVVADGDVVVATSQFDRIYAYRRQQGTVFEESLLAPPIGGPDLESAIAIDEDRIVIGTLEGAYVFEWDGSGWVVVQELATSDDVFAVHGNAPSVTIEGDLLILGAPFVDDECPGNQFCNSGAAYVFRFNGTLWVEEQRLTASNAAQSDAFGWRSAISQNRIVITARFGNNLTGSAYVFDWNGSTWVERAELISSDGVPGDLFGTSVGVTQDMIVVGATQDTGCIVGGEPCGPGAAYCYDWDGLDWTETQIITASNATNGDLFGRSLGLGQDLLLVGAPSNEAFPPLDIGAVFLFRRVGTAWIEGARLTASDAASNAKFGKSIALTNGITYIGSEDADGIESSSGAVYMLGVAGDCNEDGEIDTCEILADPSLDLNGNLELDLCDLSIPTVSAWGVAAMTLLLLAAGSVIVRRKLSVCSCQ